MIVNQENDLIQNELLNEHETDLMKNELINVHETGLMENEPTNVHAEFISIKENEIKLQVVMTSKEPKTPLFPWTRSRATALYAVAMVLWTVMMEFVAVKYACYFTGGTDPHFQILAWYGWGSYFPRKDPECKHYNELMKFDFTNITDTMHGITTWPLSNYLANSYLIASPAMLVCFVLCYKTFANRHPTVDSRGKRYWGNSIIFVLMTIACLSIIVIAFVTDGHYSEYPRYIVDQKHPAIHLTAAKFCFAGFAVYGMLMTSALLADVMMRGAVKSSVAIWTIIIYGGVCNIASAYFLYYNYLELSVTGGHHHKYEWLFMTASWVYFFTFPMLTMWAEPTAN